jgi:uncharacterized protein
MYPTDPKDAVSQWLEQIVIGLNFCPFARQPFMDNAVRIVPVDDEISAALLTALKLELEYLTAHPEVETTLVVLTRALDDFMQYNDFIHQVEDWLWQNDYEGIYQVASFHPDYCFADVPATDAGNFTNRAPYPLLHILREDRLEEMLQRYPNSDEIPDNNVRFLKHQSLQKLQTLFAYLIPRGHLVK